jgi:pyruvate dehydrogenase E1 component alpha subunit
MTAPETMPPPGAGPGPVPPPLLAAAHARKLLADMLLVRRFEERAAECYMAGSIRGFLHLAIGEEATIAGCLAALEPEDRVVSAYREHAHALLRGVRRPP